LGGRKSIRPVKNLSDEVLMWLSVWSEVQNDLHIVQLMLLPPSSFASVKSRMVLPFWFYLTQVVLKKRPLNGSI